MRTYSRIVHISTVAALTGKINGNESLEARDSLQYLADHRGVTVYGEKADRLVEFYMYGNICEDSSLKATLFAGEVVTC